MVTRLKLSFFSACPQQDVGCFSTVLHGIIPCDKWVSERICLEFVQALSVHMCLHVCVVWLQCRCVKLSRLHVVIRFEDELPHIHRVCTSCLNSRELSLCLINRFAAFEAAFFTLLGLCSRWHLGTSVQFRD